MRRHGYSEVLRQKLPQDTCGWQASSCRLQAVAHRAHLKAVESLVKTAARQKLPVCASFFDVTVVQHEDLVRVDDRAQSVGDRNRCPTLHEHGERALNLRLDLTVHGACC